MDMTDAELDRGWKPSSRRPQSTIAQSFSQELVDIFRIDNSVADLDREVEKKKQKINSQTTELEALEARIREAEKRLQQQGATPGVAASVATTATGHHRRSQLQQQHTQEPAGDGSPTTTTTTTAAAAGESVDGRGLDAADASGEQK